MPRNRTFQSSFTSGEFDQKLRDRLDIQSFFEASQLMRNFALLAQGGFTRRPGSFLLTEITEGRLIPFSYAADDALLLHLDDEGYTVYDLQGGLLQARQPSPYKADEIFEVTYVGRGNGLMLAHRNYAPRIIIRDPATNTFTMELVPFATDGNGYSQQPFSRKNKSNSTNFTVSTLNNGVATLTSDRDYFKFEHIGSAFRIEEGYGVITGFTDARTVTIDQQAAPRRVTNYEALTTSSGSDVLSISLPAHRLKVGQQINLVNYVGFNGLQAQQINGLRTIIFVFDADNIAVQLSNTANATGLGGGTTGGVEFTGPTPVMREQSFSAVNGYPNAVTVHEQRLWFGGTIEEPDVLWGSAVGEFDSFDVGRGDPADGIQVRIDDGTVNEIRHLVSSRHLQILTNESEYYAPSGDQTSLTPATFVVRKQTPYGSSRVRATLFDGATMFLQSSGRSVREFLYTDREFAYNARNIALLSQHLIRSPIQMDAIYGGLVRPEQYVFLVNADGTVTVLHSVRSEEMVGWVNWEAQGDILSLCVVGERVFWIHKHPDGTSYLEEVDFQFNYFMDGIIGLSSQTPTDTWGPVPEYANQEVAVTSGGYFLGYADVDGNGNFFTDGEYESCEVGLNYVGYARTMQAAFSLPDGPMSGLPLRLTRVVVDFGDSNSIDVDDQRLIIRQTEDTNPQDNPEPYDKKEEFWLNVISRNPSVDFVSEIPLSSTVYSLLLEIAY